MRFPVISTLPPKVALPVKLCVPFIMLFTSATKASRAVSTVVYVLAPEGTLH